MKFKLTFAKRLLKIANLVEFDGEPFDYRNAFCCAWPRGERIVGTKVNGSSFGLDTHETIYLFNQHLHEALHLHGQRERERALGQASDIARSYWNSEWPNDDLSSQANQISDAILKLKEKPASEKRPL